MSGSLGLDNETRVSPQYAQFIANLSDDQDEWRESSSTSGSSSTDDGFELVQEREVEPLEILSLDDIVKYYLENPSERPSNSWRPLSPGLNSLMNAYTIDTKNESTGTTIGKIVLWIASIVLFPISIPALLFTAGALYAKDSCNKDFKAAKEAYNESSKLEAELRKSLEKGEGLTETQRNQLKFAAADLARQSPENREQVEAKIEELERMGDADALGATFASTALGRDALALATRADVTSEEEFKRLLPQKMKEFGEVLSDN